MLKIDREYKLVYICYLSKINNAIITSCLQENSGFLSFFNEFVAKAYLGTVRVWWMIVLVYLLIICITRVVS